MLSEKKEHYSSRIKHALEEVAVLIRGLMLDIYPIEGGHKIVLTIVFTDKKNKKTFELYQLADKIKLEFEQDVDLRIKGYQGNYFYSEEYDALTKIISMHKLSSKIIQEHTTWNYRKFTFDNNYFVPIISYFVLHNADAKHINKDGLYSQIDQLAKSNLSDRQYDRYKVRIHIYINKNDINPIYTQESYIEMSKDGLVIK